MNPDDSPFSPLQPVEPSDFVGREAQIDQLIGVVRQARKSLKVAWIGGERGMGKSSLASFVGFVAERDHNALVGHAHLGGANDLPDMVRQTYLGLLKDNRRQSTGQKLFDLFGDRVEKVGAFGFEIKLNLSSDDLEADARGFAEALDELRKRVGEGKEMAVLLLDDINGLADSPAFAHWIKSMVDSMATRRLKIPVCLIFVGLPERLESIRKNNISTVRTFAEIVNIEPWTPEETKDFFRQAFEKKEIKVDAEVLDFFAKFSGGLPTVAHEIGAQAWRLIEGKKLGMGIAEEAVVHAALLIGERFIEKEVVQALGSDKYKSILNKIGDTTADVIGATFTRKELFSLGSLDESEKNVVDNFLRRMVKVGGLLSEGRGEYRFPTELHRFYFFLAARLPANK